MLLGLLAAVFSRHTLQGAIPSPWCVVGMCQEGFGLNVGPALLGFQLCCPFLPCRLLKEQEEKENKIASLIAEQSDEK